MNSNINYSGRANHPAKGAREMRTATYVSDCPEEEAVCDGIITVACPYCGEERTLEPDCFDIIDCENCQEQYRVIGVC